MNFKDMPLDLQVRLSLHKFTQHHGLSFNACGAGTYPSKVGRDVCGSFRILSQTQRAYYIYLQVSYLKDPLLHAKYSELSSIVLYDFMKEATLVKVHLSAISSMRDFLNLIEPILLDERREA